MLAFAYFLENAAAGALPLKPFERTFQGLIFADTNLRHCYPSPRSIHGKQMIKDQSENHNRLYSQCESESTFFVDTIREGEMKDSERCKIYLFRPYDPPSVCLREYENADEGQTGRRRDRS